MTPKNTFFKIIIAIIVLVLIVAVGQFFFIERSPAAEDEMTYGEMTLEEAVLIANDSECTEQGLLTENSFYNENSKTWWIDLDMKPEFVHEGCNPACVIWEETGQAEINWRCTGLILPEND
jgi:hypothetical protein